jgi:hypothetical protein
LPRRLLLSDDQRRLLAAKGKAISRKALMELTTIVTPDTILRRHRRLIAAVGVATPNGRADNWPQLRGNGAMGVAVWCNKSAGASRGQPSAYCLPTIGAVLVIR